MRSILFGFVLMFATAALAASPIAPGEYAGTGRYIGPDGSVGTYAITATADADRLVTSYSYQDEARQPQQRSMTLRFSADGTLSVTSPEHPGVMTGRCDGGLCSYAASFPGGEVMELIRITPAGIEKVGTKKFGTVTITWSETLARGK